MTIMEKPFDESTLGLFTEWLGEKWKSSYLPTHVMQIEA